MFFRLAEFLKPVDNLKQPQKGKVINNDDPKKLGRIKCTIKGIFEDDANDGEKLPWVNPQNPYGLGGKPDTSAFSIPELDSEVTIIFHHSDVYHPFYVGYWQSELTTQSLLFEEDYPESYGWIDSVIEWIRVNKAKPSVEMYRASTEDLIKLDEEGNLWINIPKSVYINIGEDSRIKITNNCVTSVGKDYQIETAGNHTRKAAGNITAKAGGDHDISVGGNQGISASGGISHQAAKIDHNSGIIWGTASIDGATLATEIGTLETKMSEMQETLAELKTLAEAIKAKADANKPNIAKVK